MLFPQYKKTGSTQEMWQKHFTYCSPRDPINQRVRKRIDFLERHIKKSAKIIEGGASLGRYIYLLKQRGFEHVEGFDVNEKLIKRAKGFGIIIKKGDVLKAPCNRSSYDVYIDMGTLEHFSPQDQDSILQQIHWLLKPDGLLFLDVTYFTKKRLLIFPVMFLLNQLQRLRGGTFYQYIYTSSEVCRLLNKNGFKVIETLKIDPRLMVLAKKYG